MNLSNYGPKLGPDERENEKEAIENIKKGESMREGGVRFDFGF